jgi:Tfp pilus assembly protein PilF
MSLINQMLQDIERRDSSSRSTSTEVPGFQSYMIAPESQAWRQPSFLALATLTVLTVGTGGWWLARQPTDTSLTVVASVPATTISKAPTVLTPSQAAISSINSKQLAPTQPDTVVPLVPQLHERAETEPPRAANTLSSSAVPSSIPVLAKPTASPSKSAVPAQVRLPELSRAEQLYQQSLEQNKQGQPDQAQKSLREALEIQPQHVQARLALAKLLVDRTQSNAAAELLADGMMLLPHQTSFTLALAPLWFQSGQQEDAIALLAQQAKLTNNNPQFHAYYASQLLRLKRHVDAATQYRIALRGDPSVEDWLIGLGLSLQGAGYNKEALDILRRAYDTGKLSGQKKDLVEQMIAGLKTKVGP